MRIRSRQRGSLMVGMSAMILITGTFCATVLLRSMETYRESARLEQSFQMLAAAEGAAVVSSAGAPQQPLEIGKCTVTFETPSTSASQQMLVEIRKPTGAVVAARRYAIDLPGSSTVKALP
jgi:hypothetical protein